MRTHKNTHMLMFRVGPSEKQTYIEKEHGQGKADKQGRKAAEKG